MAGRCEDLKKFDEIILIDSYYPFQDGEEFLENEIKYAADASKRLLIIPTRATDFSNNRLTGKGINNVRVIKKPFTRTKIRRVISKIFTLFNKKIIIEMVKMLDNDQLDLKTVNLLITYYSEAKLKYNFIRKHLDCKTFNQKNVLIYSYWLDSNALTVSMLKKRFPNILTCARCHGFDLYLERHHKNYFPMREETCKGLDLVFPISIAGANYLAERFNFFTGKISPMYLGTTDYGLNPVKSNNRFSIISCSHLIPLKRVHLIIEALSYIKEVEISWVHFGDGELMETLYKKANELLGNNIEFSFMGAISNPDLMKYYLDKHIDVFINVSSTEGIPVSIMEAMSFGIPVVATDVGGVKEIVENGKNGILLDAEFNVKSLSEHIVELNNMDNKEVQILRKNARNKWENKFSACTNYKMFYKKIFNIINEKNYIYLR